MDVGDYPGPRGNPGNGAYRWALWVAGLAVGAMRDGEVIDQASYDKAVAIAQEEIYARLCVRDYPPPMDAI